MFQKCGKFMQFDRFSSFWFQPLRNSIILIMLLLPCLFHQRGPYYLRINDLTFVKDSGAFFIQKVAKKVDFKNMFKILPVNDRDEIPHIEWPKEVEVSEKIDWWAKGVKGGKKQAMAMNYEL